MGSCLTKKKEYANIKFVDEKNQQRFKEGKPIFLQAGLNIKKNPTTNKLEGIPEQWVSNLQLPLQVDYDRVIKTEHMRNNLRPNEELPQTILQLINKPQPQKSKIKSSIVLSLGVESKISSEDLDMSFPTEWSNNSISTELGEFQSPQTLVSIISKFDEDLRESSMEREFLSSEEFEGKIKNVKFIEDHPTSNFIFKEEIGSGGVCKVFKVEAKFSPKTFYAVRIMKQTDKQTLDKIKCEIAVMELCQSPHIVQYHFTYYYRQSLFMFIEYMNAGSLTKFIKKYSKSIRQNIIAFIIKGILQGLINIHKRKQIHRDLKSDNILLNDKGILKIADFGYALQLTSDKLNTTGIAGTPAWMAPQLIMKKQYNQMIDIWSLGIIVLELCHGEPPYLRMPPLRAMYKIVSEDPPKLRGFSEELCDFVSCCLKKNPQERMSARELMKHNFIRKIKGGGEKVEFEAMIQKMMNS